MVQSVKEKIIESLLKSNFLSVDKLNEAVNLQRETSRRLSEILVTMGYISEKDLLIIFSQSLDIPPVNLSKIKIKSEVMEIIPKQLALKYNVIAVAKIGKVLTIAMVDPLDILAIDELKIFTSYELKVVIATKEDIEKAINTCYERASNAQIQGIIEDVKDIDLEVVEDNYEEAASENIQQVLKVVEDAPVVKITNALLFEAIRERASDILLEPQEKNFRVRYRVDGLLQEVPSPPKAMQDAIVSRIKVMSVLNIAEHRLPQDGRFKVKIGSREVDFRVSVLPTVFGEKIALRVLDKTAVVLDLDTLGFETSSLEKMKELSLAPHGMILICGPTGHGKSTTLYSILKYIDDPEKNVVTAEDPVEYEIEGINQVNVNPDVGLTFSGALRSFLRQDPDIIMVGEIRDTITLDIAIKAALTGHLVLSTLHTTEAAGAITRMINMGIEPFLITSSCILVAAQRLMRKLCQDCKQAYEISDEIRQNLKISEEYKTLYKAVGCVKCNMTGYRGRVALSEVLVLTPEIRDLVMKKAEEAMIKQKACQQGMITLRGNALIKALKGITTIEEVMRLTADS
ncbi:MAG: secretion system protein E [Candidatus Omnitrophota bacterium]|nr:MAG: secretion system protein E [Candidatus Omnitrophota bacterium]